MKERIVSIRMTIEMFREMCDAADFNDLSVSELIRRLCRMYLDGKFDEVL